MDNTAEFVDCQYFADRAAKVARDLVGRTLEVAGDAEHCQALIVETEAYGDVDDPASHAAFKPKGGARIMWEQPGSVYVYAAYGMYPCLNIVTESVGEPGAVLIRGVWLNDAEKPTHGPGRVGRFLGVTVADNGLLCCGPRYRVSVNRRSLDIQVTPRIGITRGVETLWRFIAQLD